MGNKCGAGAARMMTQSLDNNRSYSVMLWTCLTMGTHTLSLPFLLARAKPLHLCSIMLRMMSLVVAMQLWGLCTGFRGDKGGGASDAVCYC